MDGMLQILRLIHALGSIRGRKKFQKIVHILQSAGHGFLYHFDYLHYGPFSSELASEIDGLVPTRLMQEIHPASDREPFVYGPGDRLPAILERAGLADDPEWIDLARDLNSKDAEFLEAVSTILFLLRRRYEGPTLERRFSELKPKLAERFQVAFEYARQIVPDRARP